jgi:hypothetical protein
MVSSLTQPQEVRPQEEDHDDLEEYLPEVNDEQNKKILEEGAMEPDQMHSQDEEVRHTNKS